MARGNGRRGRHEDAKPAEVAVPAEGQGEAQGGGSASPVIDAKGVEKALLAAAIERRRELNDPFTIVTKAMPDQLVALANEFTVKWLVTQLAAQGVEVSEWKLRDWLKARSESSSRRGRRKGEGSEGAGSDSGDSENEAKSEGEAKAAGGSDESEAKSEGEAEPARERAHGNRAARHHERIAMATGEDLLAQHAGEGEAS